MHCLVQSVPKWVIASKKLRGALYKIAQEQHRINFSKLTDSSFFDATDDYIRIACSMFRTLEKDASSYTRFMKKASAAEKAMVDEVISHLSLEAVEMLAGTSSGDMAKEETADPQGPGPELPRRAAAEAATTTTAATEEDVPASTFRRILARKESDEPQPSSSSKQLPVPSFHRQMASFHLDRDEKKELEEWMQDIVDERKPTAPKLKKKQKKAAAGKKKEAGKPSKAGGSAGTAGKHVAKAGAFLKRTWRHRKSSSIYHSARKKAEKEGLSARSCLAAGRKSCV